MNRHITWKLGRSVGRLQRTISDNAFTAKKYIRGIIRSISQDKYPTDLSFMPNGPDLFTPAESDGSEDEDTANVLIPCEFCNTLKRRSQLNHHQRNCQENPNRRRRHRSEAEHEVTDTDPEERLPRPSAPIFEPSLPPIDDNDIPKPMKCPLSLEMYREPVIASDGNTYEKEFIVNWLRTHKTSPLTREPMTCENLTKNRVVNDIIDNFRETYRQQQSRLACEYSINVNVAKVEETPYMQSSHTSVYRAKALELVPKLQDPVSLVLLTGANAERIAIMNCKIEAHPYVVRTFGRVAHDGTGVLIVQECLSDRTLSEVLKSKNTKWLIVTIDTMVLQMLAALVFIEQNGIVHGEVTAKNILVYRLDDTPDSVLVKLTNVGYTLLSQEGSNDGTSLNEKSDVCSFGELAQELYSLDIETNGKALETRNMLFETCLTGDSDHQPTFCALMATFKNLLESEITAS